MQMTSPEREQAEALRELIQSLVDCEPEMSSHDFSVKALPLLAQASDALAAAAEHVCDEAGFEHGHDLARRRYEPRLLEAEAERDAARHLLQATGRVWAAAVERERELTRALAAAHETLGDLARCAQTHHRDKLRNVAEYGERRAGEALAGGVSAAGRPYGTLGQDTRSWIERQGGFTTGHGGTSDQRTFSSDPYPAAPEVSPRKPAHPPKDASNHTGRAAPEVLPEETRP